MSSGPRLTGLVLQALDEGGPHDGYALMAAVDALGGDGHRLSPGRLYPTLVELEDRRLVVSAVSADGGRYYSLTPTGRSALGRYHRSQSTGPDTALRTGPALSAMPARERTVGRILDAFSSSAPCRDVQVGPVAAEAILELLADVEVELTQLVETDPDREDV
ncbi:MAG TPA: helix-turn-helix transcriptional regulator [Acidimicrobiales bacterium]|nr:helix-turn-helix transcriptional regulator [Acidimicrobiales bacterium]